MAEAHFWTTDAFKEVAKEAERLKKSEVHLRDLLKDSARIQQFNTVHEKIYLDASRCLIDIPAWKSLVELYKGLKIPEKIEAMFRGDKINGTEQRAVLHTVLRSHKTDKHFPAEAVKDVHQVLDRIATFSEAVRTGSFTGHTGKKLVNVVCIGIGGSYLGVEFVYEALRFQDKCKQSSQGRQLRFLANVDPIDVARALNGLCPEQTLVVVISKTFTTAETMLNARTVRDWLLRHYKGDASSISKHVCAVSTNSKATSDFGIDEKNVFGFWDWVGGRFSVCSAVGVLPLSLQYGFPIVRNFLDGCRNIDDHFRSEQMMCKNIPVMMGVMSWWNSVCLNYGCVAVLPYCQALLRFPAHIQQLTMESNGKRVTMDGTTLPSLTYSGEGFFGEPGTNGQHSFYQLIHQGRIVPCEFIGFTRSQNEISLQGELVSNHQELMSNFFAQPDALALGKTADQLKAEGCSPELIPHKTFPGNRPSMMLLFDSELGAFETGQLLAIYEHRTAVEGFLTGINSFDQWGVELGKVLAKEIRTIMANQDTTLASKLPQPTRNLLQVFLNHH